MIELEVKVKKGIKSTLSELPAVDEEGNEYTFKGTEYIPFTDEVTTYLNKTITVNVDYNSPDDELDPLPTDGVVFAPTDSDTVLLHYKWVKSINGEPLIDTIDASNPAIQLTNNLFLIKSTSELKHKDDLEICTICGAVNEELDDGMCSKCVTEKYFKVHNYSHKPDFKFTGNQVGKYNKDNPIWYGIELEYGLQAKDKMVNLLRSSNDTLFLKSDSTISGGNHQAEMVSHPCSFDYLKSEDSWVNSIDTLDAVDKPENNGCHIHISRTAFSDDKHYAKFKYLVHSNLPLLEAIGGRKLTNYCKPFAPKNKVHSTKKNSRSGDKSVVCNECNRDTIELRFMASSNEVDQVFRYIEYLDSMIKYTAYHTKKATYKGYAKYVNKYKSKYESILNFINGTEIDLTGEITYTTPKVKVVNLNDIKASDILHITHLKIIEEDDSIRQDVDISLNEISVSTNVQSGVINYIAGYDIRSGETALVTITKA